MSRFHEMLAKGQSLQEAAAAPKAAKKPAQPLTQNPGQGYHGVAFKKRGSDSAKAHAEFKKMHAKVKDLAGEAGHLVKSKKPNIMVRDYLDSSRGRHLEGLEADDKYIKKDFGGFARSYDPKLFEESYLAEGDVSFHEKPDDWYKDGRTKVEVHHKGKHVATIQKLDTMTDHERHIIVSPDTSELHHDSRFNDPLPDKYKKKTLLGKVKPGQEHLKHSKGFDSRRSALRYAKNVYSGKINEGFDTGPEKSAAGMLKVILEAKRVKEDPHPDSLVDHEIDDEGFATRPGINEGLLDRFKKKKPVVRPKVTHQDLSSSLEGHGFKKHAEDDRRIAYKRPGGLEATVHKGANSYPRVDITHRHSHLIDEIHTNPAGVDDAVSIYKDYTKADFDKHGELNSKTTKAKTKVS